MGDRTFLDPSFFFLETNLSLHGPLLLLVVLSPRGRVSDSLSMSSGAKISAVSAASSPGLVRWIAVSI